MKYNSLKSSSPSLQKNIIKENDIFILNVHIMHNKIVYIIG